MARKFQDFTLNQELLQRIQQIRWFSTCGEPHFWALNLQIKMVSSWEQAIKYCMSLEWENNNLNARNSITEFLFAYYRNDYNLYWNRVAEAGGTFIEQQVEPIITELLAKEHHVIINSVKWDVINIILADYYSKFNLPTGFYFDLLVIYETGHFPCGWVDGEWPQGKLVLY